MIEFLLAFFVDREEPSRESLFRQLNAVRVPGGVLLPGVPMLFHLSRKEFQLRKDGRIT